MNNLIKKLEKFGTKLEPIASKLSDNMSLMAIKDGFITVMPLLIIGSFVIVLNNVVLEWGPNSLWYSIGIKVPEDFASKLAEFKIIGQFVAQGSIAIISLLVSFTIAYFYTSYKKNDALSAGVLSLAGFMCLQLWQVEFTSENGEVILVSAINSQNLGTANIISAIFVALTSSKIYNYFIKKDLMIKMPQGVPPGVNKAFQALIPGTAIITLFALIASILSVNNTEFSEIISTFIASPLQEFGAKGPFVAYFYVTFSNILYFFGIHGPNVLAFIEASVLTPASITNAQMIADGTNSTIVFSKGMLDSFVFLGGGGATLGLIISIFIVSKSESERSIAKFALTPALFNINEPLVFGLPIVMNPILFIPFVLLPSLLLTTAWIQITILNSLGLLNNIGGVLVPWVSPVGIGAFLSYQNFWVVIVALIQLLISIIVYLPFVFAMNNANKKINKE